MGKRSERNELIDRMIEAGKEIDRARADNPACYVLVKNPVVLSILKTRIGKGTYE
mgnify:CR=1 FL=1